jgi:hypothetical protein
MSANTDFKFSFNENTKDAGCPKDHNIWGEPQFLHFWSSFVGMLAIVNDGSRVALAVANGKARGVTTRDCHAFRYVAYNHHDRTRELFGTC